MTQRRDPGDLISLDPQAQNEPFGFDYTEFLAEIGPSELVTVSTWSFSGRDALLGIAEPSIVTGQLKTQAKFSHPTKGVKYRVVNHFTTNSGIQGDRSFYLLGQDT